MAERARISRAVLACGGTGGHVYPAVAIAREIRRREAGAAVTFIGRPDSYESAVLACEGFEMEPVSIGRLAGQGVGVKLRTLAQMPGAVLRSRDILRRRRPQVVIGTGGFVSGPAMLAAATLSLPALVQEQNAIPGLTNRVLWRLADRVALPHEDATRPAPKYRVTGNPVRPEFWNVAPWEPREPFTLLVLGGSQGARALTGVVLDALGRLGDLAPRMRAVVQSGPRWEAEAREKAARLAVPVEVHAYLNDVPQRFEAATLACMRAGASSVAELCATGRPALLVPFPHAAGDHQTANAKALARTGAAEWIAEPSLTADALAARLRSAVENPESLRPLAVAARAAAHPDAAARIVDLAEEIARDGEAA